MTRSTEWMMALINFTAFTYSTYHSYLQNTQIVSAKLSTLSHYPLGEECSNRTLCESALWWFHRHCFFQFEVWRPGVLRFMGSQSRTRLSNWTELNNNPFLPPGDRPHPGIEPRSPALQVDSTIWATREAPTTIHLTNGRKYENKDLVVVFAWS